jgi:hypothetical protein
MVVRRVPAVVPRLGWQPWVRRGRATEARRRQNHQEQEAITKRTARDGERADRPGGRPNEHRWHQGVRHERLDGGRRRGRDGPAFRPGGQADSAGAGRARGKQGTGRCDDGQAQPARRQGRGRDRWTREGTGQHAGDIRQDGSVLPVVLDSRARHRGLRTRRQREQQGSRGRSRPGTSAFQGTGSKRRRVSHVRISTRGLHGMAQGGGHMAEDGVVVQPSVGVSEVVGGIMATGPGDVRGVHGKQRVRGAGVTAHRGGRGGAGGEELGLDAAGDQLGWVADEPDEQRGDASVVGAHDTGRRDRRGRVQIGSRGEKSRQRQDEEGKRGEEGVQGGRRAVAGILPVVLDKRPQRWGLPGQPVRGGVREVRSARGRGDGCVELPDAGVGMRHQPWLRTRQGDGTVVGRDVGEVEAGLREGDEEGGVQEGAGGHLAMGAARCEDRGREMFHVLPCGLVDMGEVIGDVSRRGGQG